MEKYRKGMTKRIAALSLAVILAANTIDLSVFAASQNDAVITGGLCEHHTEHTSDCGYTEAQEGADCTHEHDAECGYTVSGNDVCDHEHDDTCGYVEAVEGSPCTYICEECSQNEDEQEQQSEEEPAECTCGTDDQTLHATNCSAYIAPENPECTCAEKCTEDNMNVWCDVCGFDVTACTGEDTVVLYDTYTVSVDSSKDAGIITVTDGNTATAGVDYYGKISLSNRYSRSSDFELIITIGGTATENYSLAAGELYIPAESVTGDIVITWNGELIRVDEIVGDACGGSCLAGALTPVETIWADDYSSATFSYPCAFCTDTLTVPATKISSAVIVESTCSTKGTLRYTATTDGLSGTKDVELELDPDAHSTDAEGDKAATCTDPAYCSLCKSNYGEVDTDNHNFNPADGKCSGCKTELAVASVTISGTTTYYETLADAATAAQTGTEDAPATLKLEQNIDLGESWLETDSGVFTFDLNGKTLSGSNSTGYGTLNFNGGNVIITDTNDGGAITCSTYMGVSI